MAEEHPDLGGWWRWDSPDNGDPPRPFSDAPYKDEIATRMKSFRDLFRQARVPDLADLGIDQRRYYCQPPRFAGFNGGFADDIEFLFTFGRVTITNESGLIRRVPLDAALSADVEESNAGASTAHWEGQTLVVETVGMRSDTAGRLGSNWGRNARIVERISLRKPDVMQIVVNITAPDVLKGPYETTLTYFRDRGHVFHDESPCVQNDASIDPVTGRQRLDMTPPTDLPPPPRD